MQFWDLAIEGSESNSLPAYSAYIKEALAREMINIIISEVIRDYNAP